MGYYPSLAREFQGLRVWGKFVFRTLELTDTLTNLVNQVKYVTLLTNHSFERSKWLYLFLSVA